LGLASVALDWDWRNASHWCITFGGRLVRGVELDLDWSCGLWQRTGTGEMPHTGVYLRERLVRGVELDLDWSGWT